MGSIPPPPPLKSAACPANDSFTAGESITLTAAPDPHWSVGSWAGTNNNTSTALTNTLSMPTSSTTTTVNYNSDCFTLSLVCQPGAWRHNQL